MVACDVVTGPNGLHRADWGGRTMIIPVPQRSFVPLASGLWMSTSEGKNVEFLGEPNVCFLMTLCSSSCRGHSGYCSRSIAAERPCGHGCVVFVLSRRAKGESDFPREWWRPNVVREQTLQEVSYRKSWSC